MQGKRVSSTVFFVLALAPEKDPAARALLERGRALANALATLAR